MAFSFEDLKVYKKAVDFAIKAYALTDKFPDREKFGLSSQLRRATVSISANIAEGSGRYNKKDFAQFLRIARGSVYECVPLLEISFQGRLIDKACHEELLLECNDLAKMINGLISSLLNTKN